MYKVDLNSDLGESFGAYTIGLDSQVIPYVSSANVACGYHAGDPLVMDQTVAAAKAAGVAVGAHPGYPDLMGFGRRNLACSPKEVKAYVQYQLGALMAFAKHKGSGLAFACELMAGLLSGGGTIQPGHSRDGSIVNNMTAFVIDPAVLTDMDFLKNEDGQSPVRLQPFARQDKGEIAR